MWCLVLVVNETAFNAKYPNISADGNIVDVFAMKESGLL